MDLQMLLIEDIKLLVNWLHINEVILNVLDAGFVVICSRAKMQELKENVELIIQG